MNKHRSQKRKKNKKKRFKRKEVKYFKLELYEYKRGREGQKYIYWRGKNKKGF